RRSFTIGIRIQSLGSAKSSRLKKPVRLYFVKIESCSVCWPSERAQVSLHSRTCWCGFTHVSNMADEFMALTETNLNEAMGRSDSNEEIIVSVRGLTKVFKDFWGRPKARAGDDVDFEVGRGGSEAR